MLFRLFSRFFLVFLIFFPWGKVMASPLSLYDENRVLNASQIHYLKQLAQELNHATGFELTLILVDNYPQKTDYSPKKQQLLIFTSYKQQRNFVKAGKELELFLPHERVDYFRQEYLFPEYRVGRYDRGTISLAYHLVKEIVQKKGGTLTLPPPKSTLDSPMGTEGWIFILLVFVPLAIALKKRMSARKKVNYCRDFKYGRFGWR